MSAMTSAGLGGVANWILLVLAGIIGLASGVMMLVFCVASAPNTTAQQQALLVDVGLLGVGVGHLPVGLRQLALGSVQQPEVVGELHVSPPRSW